MRHDELLEAMKELAPRWLGGEAPENVLLSWAKEARVSPAVLEKAAFLYNQAKTNRHLEDNPEDRGSSFPVLDAGALLEKYAAWTPEPEKQATPAGSGDWFENLVESVDETAPESWWEEPERKAAAVPNLNRAFSGKAIPSLHGDGAELEKAAAALGQVRRASDLEAGVKAACALAERCEEQLDALVEEISEKIASDPENTDLRLGRLECPVFAKMEEGVLRDVGPAAKPVLDKVASALRFRENPVHPVRCDAAVLDERKLPFDELGLNELFKQASERHWEIQGARVVIREDAEELEKLAAVAIDPHAPGGGTKTRGGGKGGGGKKKKNKGPGGSGRGRSGGSGGGGGGAPGGSRGRRTRGRRGRGRDSSSPGGRENRRTSHGSGRGGGTTPGGAPPSDSAAGEGTGSIPREKILYTEDFREPGGKGDGDGKGAEKFVDDIADTISDILDVGGDRLDNFTDRGKALMEGPHANDKQKAVDNAAEDTDLGNSFAEAIVSDPILREADQNELARHFATIAKASPDAAADPNLLRFHLREALQYQGVDPATFQNLAKTQETLLKNEEKTQHSKKDRWESGGSPRSPKK